LAIAAQVVVDHHNFLSLEEEGPLQGEPGTLIDIGLANHYMGDASEACNYLMRAHRADPLRLRGADALAAALYKEKKWRELERLSSKLIQVTEEAAEPWVAMGYHCFANKNKANASKAVYFAHKACLADTRNVEALLLKGSVLLDLKKVNEATSHFREGLLIMPHRYELHKGQDNFVSFVQMIFRGIFCRKLNG